MLREPLLYLSLFLKQHRQRYYELLEVVRREGDWERWLAFFAEAVKTTAAGAVQTARTLVELFRADRERIGTLGRATGSALRVRSGSLRNASFRTDRYFGFAVPTSLPGVEPHILDPVKTWADKTEFDQIARALVAMFQKNFARFEAQVDADVRAAAPEVKLAAE